MTAAAAKWAEHLRQIGRRRAELREQLRDLRDEMLESTLSAYAAGMKVTDVADLLGVSRERIYQYLREAAALRATPK